VKKKITFVRFDGVELIGQETGLADQFGRKVYQFEDGLWVCDGFARWPYESVQK